MTQQSGSIIQCVIMYAYMFCMRVGKNAAQYTEECDVYDYVYGLAVSLTVH